MPPTRNAYRFHWRLSWEMKMWVWFRPKPFRSIGGDPRHYRYMAFPICLALCACSGLVERILPSLTMTDPAAPGVAAGRPRKD